MKWLVISVILVFNAAKVRCQDLSGIWKGTYVFGTVAFPSFMNNIYLEFKLNEDSTYQVYSYTKTKYIDGKDTAAVCKVTYKMKTNRTLILQETELISPDTLPRLCFQWFTLKIKQSEKGTILEGRYTTNCNSNGEVYFVKE